MHERCYSQVTEIGISTLDTRDLTGVAPGTDGEEWKSRKVLPTASKRIQKSCPQPVVRGYPANFESGIGEWVASEDLRNAVQACFGFPSFFNGATRNPARLCSLGTTLTPLYSISELANVHILGNCGVSLFADRIDTAASFQHFRGETEPLTGRSHWRAGNDWWNLHDDVRYILQALVAMLINHSVSESTGSLKSGEAPYVCVEMGD
ncbi:hypothetical protein BDW66DRAFT_22062 [Aspergillus desertorum]